MTPRSMATNQVRRRKRPIPSVPPTPPAPDVTQPRYYCPGCGQVRPKVATWVVEDDRTEVRKHYVYRSGPWPKGDEYKAGEPLAKEICSGGEIDLIADRAP